MPSKPENRPAHSYIGASSASRWFKCAGSVKMSAGVVSLDTHEAQEGTAAHIVAAGCLNRSQDAWEWIGQVIRVEREDGGKDDEFTVDQEMAENLQVYLDAIRGDWDPDADPLFVEAGFTLDDIDEDAYGTVDAAVVGRDLLRVYDLKFGAGIVVEVEGNEQAMYYTVGLISWLVKRKMVVPPEVELVIAQPRIDHPDGFVRRWRISVDNLAAWAHTTLKQMIADTRADDPPLVVGEHCRFCPGKAKCPEIRDVFDDFVEGHPKELAEMDDWELAERMERVPAARKFIGYLEDETFARRKKGKDVPGWKIVPKKSNRVWKEGAEEVLVDVLGEEAAYTHKLRTPAQVDKLGKKGKTITKEHAYKPDTGLTLAPESDKREAVASRTIEEVFGHIE